MRLDKLGVKERERERERRVLSVSSIARHQNKLFYHVQRLGRQMNVLNLKGCPHV